MPGSGSVLRRLRCPLCFALVSLLWAFPSWGQDAVSLQLKWLHQFQFAGYYQALEQGFYRDVGLQVDIREGGPNVVVATELAKGKADFGVCTTNVLTDDHNGAGLTVLNNVLGDLDPAHQKAAFGLSLQPLLKAFPPPTGTEIKLDPTPRPLGQLPPALK